MDECVCTGEARCTDWEKRCADHNRCWFRLRGQGCAHLYAERSRDVKMTWSDRLRIEGSCTHIWEICRKSTVLMDFCIFLCLPEIYFCHCVAVIIVINLHDCIQLMDDFYVVCSQAYCCGFHFLALLFALGHLTGHTWGGLYARVFHWSTIVCNSHYILVVIKVMVVWQQVLNWYYIFWCPHGLLVLAHLDAFVHQTPQSLYKRPVTWPRENNMKLG